MVRIVGYKDRDKKLSKNALPYLMFFKRKGIEKVKSRGCIDGSNMRKHILHEDTRSLTASTYALIASYCIDAIENKKVYTLDIQE